MCPCDGNDAWYIDQTKRWICWRLYPYELWDARSDGCLGSLSGDTDLGIVTDGVINLHLVGCLEVQECCFQPLVLLRHAGHVTESSAINVVDADDVCVVAEGLKYCGSCGRARRKGESVGTPGFERQ